MEKPDRRDPHKKGWRTAGVLWLPWRLQTVKNLPAVWETQVWSLGREDLLEKGNGYPLQYSCLGNPMDRAAWQATQSIGSHRAGHDWVTNALTTFTLSVVALTVGGTLVVASWWSSWWSRVCGPGSALTNGLWLRGCSGRMFMASGALWTAVQDSWKSLGEAGVEQLGMAQRRFDRGGEGPGRGDRAQLWASEVCEESPSRTSAHLGGQEGDSIRAYLILQA